MNIFDEFNKRRESGNKQVMAQDFLPYKRFFNLDTNAYNNGSLESKTKHLIGLSSSLVLGCNDCILYHIEQAFNEGATKDELNETLNIALVIGGSIIIPELRKALTAIDELYNKQQSDK
jgi:AhpD family alkylhydroperoxidase